MFSDDQTNVDPETEAQLDAYIRRIVREKYRVVVNPDGSRSVSDTQLWRGRQAHAALESDPEVVAAIAAATRRYPAVAGDAQLAGSVKSQVAFELIRGHAERGYNSLPAMAATIAGRRANTLAAVARAHGADLVDPQAAIAPRAGRLVAPERTVEEQVIDTIDGVEPESLVALDDLADGLTRRKREVYDLLTSELELQERLLDSAAEQNLITGPEDGLTNANIAAILTMTTGRRMTKSAASTYRNELTCELRAMVLVLTAGALVDGDAASQLALLIERAMDGDMELADLAEEDKNVRGQATRLAKFLAERRG